MKGWCKKKDNKWFIVYRERNYEGEKLFIEHELPVHPDDVDSCTCNVAKEFDIVDYYVEPPESIHCNRGGDIKVAKFRVLPSYMLNSLSESIKTEEQGREFMAALKRITHQEKDWLDVFVKWQVGQCSHTIDGLQHFLDMNYEPPVRK